MNLSQYMLMNVMLKKSVLAFLSNANRFGS